MYDTVNIERVSNGFIVTYPNTILRGEQKIFVTLKEVYDFLQEYFDIK